MNDSQTILVADDEPNIRRVLSALFEKSSFTVLTAENGRRAVELAKAHEVDVLISDLIMPDMSGVDVLREVRAIHPLCAAIIVTAYGTIKTAVEAMRIGAYDYITKPFDVDDVVALVKRAIADQGRSPEPARKPTKPQTRRYDEIVGTSAPMQELYDMVERVADSRATVLIRGESGTGKELIARALHFGSARSEKPFVPVSCAALPETLLESELFGHEKNAFTGANAQKPGRFELANHGTLFLDEVAEIPLPLQVKLLRVLQEREFERIGGTKSIKVDVRVISATNKDVEKAVADGEFREDLYYRLQVIQLYVPPLRERIEDIAALTKHFVQRYATENDRKVSEVTPETLDLLQHYSFPGNVRELENIVQRAVVIADRDTTVLTPDLLPSTVHHTTAKTRSAKRITK